MIGFYPERTGQVQEAHNVYERDDFQGEPEAHDDYRERMALADKIDAAMARDREG